MTASEQAESAGGPRILLVDDEPRIRDFISRALETAGYAVDAACSGTEGLRQAVAGDYDLIALRVYAKGGLGGVRGVVCRVGSMDSFAFPMASSFLSWSAGTKLSIVQVAATSCNTRSLSTGLVSSRQGLRLPLTLSSVSQEKQMKTTPRRAI